MCSARAGGKLSFVNAADKGERPVAVQHAGPATEVAQRNRVIRPPEYKARRPTSGGTLGLSRARQGGLRGRAPALELIARRRLLNTRVARVCFNRFARRQSPAWYRASLWLRCADTKAIRERVGERTRWKSVSAHIKQFSGRILRYCSIPHTSPFFHGRNCIRTGLRSRMRAQ